MNICLYLLLICSLMNTGSTLLTKWLFLISPQSHTEAFLTCHLIQNKKMISIWLLAEIGRKGTMLEGVPLRPVDSYIHFRLFSTGISTESFLGKKTALTDMHQCIQSYADDTCKGENGWQGQRASASAAKNESQWIFHWNIKVCRARSIGCAVQMDKQIQCDWISQM